MREGVAMAFPPTVLPESERRRNSVRPVYNRLETSARKIPVRKRFEK
jgi:hypothetical protein